METAAQRSGRRYMIQIYECTDCEHCASFDFGLRVFCLHPDLHADEVYNYEPVGDKSAHRCKGFDEGYPSEFSIEQLHEAEDYSAELVGDFTYDGVRAWCLKERS